MIVNVFAKDKSEFNEASAAYRLACQEFDAAVKRFNEACSLVKMTAEEIEHTKAMLRAGMVVEFSR